MKTVDSVVFILKVSLSVLNSTARLMGWLKFAVKSLELYSPVCPQHFHNKQLLNTVHSILSDSSELHLALSLRSHKPEPAVSSAISMMNPERIR